MKNIIITLMGTAVAILRFIILAIALIVMMLVIWLFSWFPFKYEEAALSIWATTWLCRFINRVLNVHVTFDNPDVIKNHHGFIFPNHTTFLDILVLMGTRPVRFLSMAELAKWPVIGNIAKSIETVFVNRSDKESRQAARASLSDVPKYPPIILFPEGAILPPPTEIKPLRFGAFEIAQGANAPFMPCVLVYEDPDLVFWTDKNTFKVAWNFCKHLTRVNVRVCPLPPVQPQPEDDPAQLAQETQQAMAAVLAGKR